MPIKITLIARSLLSAGLFAILLGSTRTATAQQLPFTLERTSLGAGVRYATEDYNFGLGARGGYTLRQQVYIGGLFDYWFGKTKDETLFGNGISAKASGWNLLGVAGYDFGVAENIVLRPYGGFGLFHGSGKVCTKFVNVENCVDQSSDDAAGVIGGEALFRFDSFHVGGELRVLFASDTALVLGGNIGVDL